MNEKRHYGRLIQWGPGWFIARPRWGFLRIQWSIHHHPLPYIQIHLEKQPRGFYDRPERDS